MTGPHRIGTFAAMMKTPILVLAIVVLLFTGCHGPGWIKARKLNTLSLGMTKAEVVKTLGEPHSSDASEGVSRMWYLEDEGSWKHQPYYVEFRNDKLTAYGRGDESSAGAGGGQVIYTPIRR